MSLLDSVFATLAKSLPSIALCEICYRLPIAYYNGISWSSSPYLSFLSLILYSRCSLQMKCVWVSWITFLNEEWHYCPSSSFTSYSSSGNLLSSESSLIGLFSSSRILISCNYSGVGGGCYIFLNTFRLILSCSLFLCLRRIFETFFWASSFS